MLKSYFKLITICNIPDTISIIFNKRLLLIYINTYIIIFFFLSII